ncbi:MAG: membrane protein insertase YidC [Candidatus Nanopelagicales bacterium]
MSTIFAPFIWLFNRLEDLVSWILITFHSLLSPVFGETSGWSWSLSIIGLVIVIRIALIPLFVKQIRAVRNMQAIQPQIKELQKKYADNREKLGQEMMKLYRETGTNPFASCLPILLQAPIFFALFRVLQGIALNKPEGIFANANNIDLIDQAREALVVGVPIYATLLNADETPSATSTIVLTVFLIIFMSATTFITQRQLIVKNSAPNNPMVQQQKILLYVFPIIFAVGGIGFPIGVLIYWSTTNLWSMFQQFWVIRNSPTPGSPAYDAWQQRKQEKRRKKGIADEPQPKPEEEQPPAPRQQPKKQPRQKRKKKK